MVLSSKDEYEDLGKSTLTTLVLLVIRLFSLRCTNPFTSPIPLLVGLFLFASWLIYCHPPHNTQTIILILMSISLPAKE